MVVNAACTAAMKDCRAALNCGGPAVADPAVDIAFQALIARSP
jgi:hypothetical protein